MVIAPHPDDEVIGCGGTILRHAKAGDPVSVVYLTSGEKSCGYPWLSPAQRKLKRKQEAQSSCKVLNVRDTVFLEGVDGQCSDPEVSAALTGPISAAIEAHQPVVIYVPHADDNHPDHAAAYRLLRGIVAASTRRPSILQYELWSPMHADYAVDVSSQMRAKIRAIKLHELALDAFDYIPTMVGLAAYRSGTMLQRKGYAEAFKRTPDL